MACNGLAVLGPQETAEGQKLSRNGLTDFAPADPHEVRARLTRRGSLNGYEWPSTGEAAETSACERPVTLPAVHLSASF